MKKEPYNRPVMTIIMLERSMAVVASDEGDCSPVNEPGNNCSGDCETDGQSSDNCPRYNWAGVLCTSDCYPYQLSSDCDVECLTQYITP